MYLVIPLAPSTSITMMIIMFNAILPVGCLSCVYHSEYYGSLSRSLSLLSLPLLRGLLLLPCLLLLLS